MLAFNMMQWWLMVCEKKLEKDFALPRFLRCFSEDIYCIFFSHPDYHCSKFSLITLLFLNYISDVRTGRFYILFYRSIYWYCFEKVFNKRYIYIKFGNWSKFLWSSSSLGEYDLQYYLREILYSRQNFSFLYIDYSLPIFTWKVKWLFYCIKSTCRYSSVLEFHFSLSSSLFKAPLE